MVLFSFLVRPVNIGGKPALPRSELKTSAAADIFSILQLHASGQLGEDAYRRYKKIFEEYSLTMRNYHH